jgi:hypothetical protein
MNISVIDNFEIDSSVLLAEYEHHIQDKLISHINPHVDIVVQQYLYIVWEGNWIHLNRTNNMSVTKSIVNRVATVYDFDTVVYRVLDPGTNYRWHIDVENECYHIPLKTNIGCLFVYEDKNYRMPADKLYKVKNGIPHTFVNAGDTPRIHLVFENKNKGINK